MNDNSKIALSILGGAVAGAVAGLLLAPNKGTETRAQLVDGADRLKSNLQHQAERGMDTINNLLGRADSKLGELEREVSDSLGLNRESKAGRNVKNGLENVANSATDSSNTGSRI